MLKSGEKEIDELEQALEAPLRPEAQKKPAESIWSKDETETWEADMMAVFVKSQLRVALALPILAVLFFAVNVVWVPLTTLSIWLASVLAAQGVQLFICKMYNPENRDKQNIRDWVGRLAASEFLFAICWANSLVFFWEAGNPIQHVFIVATLMAVATARIMIANYYLPVILAGTGVLTFAIVVRCTFEATPVHVGLGAMAFLGAVYFIQLSKGLQKTARDMHVFKAEREKLIADLKKAKLEAEHGRKRAEVANVAKSRFLATMSHELRTPLNAILGFSEILSEEMMGPHAVSAYKEYSGDIHQSGGYLLHLINDILDLSRIEAGKHQMNEEPVNFREVFDTCKRLMKSKLAEKGQEVSVEWPEDLPKLRADERAVRQIWLNLLSNASKFSPEATRITTGVEVLPNHRLALYVSDEGPGMTHDEIQAVQGLFNRGEMADKQAIDGAGLGLPIVSGLARLHGGEVQIRSEPGKGTDVTVIFPSKRVLNDGQEAVLASLAKASQTQRRLVQLTA